MDGLGRWVVRAMRVCLPGNRNRRLRIEIVEGGLPAFMCGNTCYFATSIYE